MTRLLLDPWSTDYQASVQAEDSEAASSEVQVDNAVEMVHWAPVQAREPPDSAVFVDGVRRLEARVIGRRPEGLVHGLFASFGTGAAVITSKSAVFSDCKTARRVILTAGLFRSESLRVGNTEMRFEGISVAADDPNATLLALQAAMRDAELALARSLSPQIVFLDGPLAFVTEPPGPVVGVVKTIHRIYLDAEKMDFVVGLRTGERSPVFAIIEGQKIRYSWYLRIAQSRPIHHGFSGVMRLEASAAGGVESAIDLANKSAAFLPRFASSANRDPRAPQNLTPVGALEQHLRNQLGDSVLIQRAIEKRISEGLTL